MSSSVVRVSNESLHRAYNTSICLGYDGYSVESVGQTRTSAFFAWAADTCAEQLFTQMPTVMVDSRFQSSLDSYITQNRDHLEFVLKQVVRDAVLYQRSWAWINESGLPEYVPYDWVQDVRRPIRPTRSPSGRVWFERLDFRYGERVFFDSASQASSSAFDGVEALPIRFSRVLELRLQKPVMSRAYRFFVNLETLEVKQDKADAEILVRAVTSANDQELVNRIYQGNDTIVAVPSVISSRFRGDNGLIMWVDNSPIIALSTQLSGREDATINKILTLLNLPSVLSGVESNSSESALGVLDRLSRSSAMWRSLQGTVNNFIGQLLAHIISVGVGEMIPPGSISVVSSAISIVEQQQRVERENQSAAQVEMLLNQMEQQASVGNVSRCQLTARNIERVYVNLSQPVKDATVAAVKDILERAQTAHDSPPPPQIDPKVQADMTQAQAAANLNNAMAENMAAAAAQKRAQIPATALEIQGKQIENQTKSVKLAQERVQLQSDIVAASGAGDQGAGEGSV